MIRRSAVAAWAGGVENGVGTVSCDSGVLSNTRYGFRARFEDGPGTNPEELIAAAQAGCFAMALADQFEALHLTPKNLRTAVTVVLDQIGDSHAISQVHIDLTARVPGIDQRLFDALVNRAKSHSLVAKLLGVPVTLTARLEA